MFECLNEIADRIFGVAVLYAAAHTVPEVSLEYYLPDLMQRVLRRVDLDEDILAGYVLVDHPLDGVHLSGDLPQPQMQVL